MLKRLEGLDCCQKLCAHVAMGKFMATEHIYGFDRKDQYLQDEADLGALIEFEKMKTVKIINEFASDLTGKPITDDDMKFHLNPSLNATEEDRDSQNIILSKQDTPMYAQMVANVVKQETAKISQQKERSPEGTPKASKKVSTTKINKKAS